MRQMDLVIELESSASIQEIQDLQDSLEQALHKLPHKWIIKSFGTIIKEATKNGICNR